MWEVPDFRMNLASRLVWIRDNAVFLSYGDAAAEKAGGTRALALRMIRDIFADVKAMSEAEDMDKFKAKGSLKNRELKALLPC